MNPSRNKKTHAVSLFVVLMTGAGQSLLATSLEQVMPAPMLEFNFDESGDYIISRSPPVTLILLSSAGIPVDLHGAAGSGVSGAVSDRAFDISARGMGASFLGGVASSQFDVESIDAIKSFTITGWFKTGGMTPIGNNARLFDNMNEASGDAGFQLFAGTDGTLSLQINNSGYISANGAYSMMQGWVFFAVTCRVGGTHNVVKYYIGTTYSQVSLVNTVIGAPATQMNNATGFALGNRDACDRPFGGLIDNIRLYGSSTLSDGALSLGQLERIRAADVNHETINKQ